MHRHGRTAEALDANLVTQRLLESFPQDNAHIFNRVMGIDLDITFRLDGQIKEAVTRNRGEHVVEKGHRAFDVMLARSVQIQFDADVGLFCFTLNFCFP